MRKILAAAALFGASLGITVLPTVVEAKITGCYGVIDKRPVDRDFVYWYNCKGPGSARSTIHCSTNGRWSGGNVTTRTLEWTQTIASTVSVSHRCPLAFPHILEASLLKFS